MSTIENPLVNPYIRSWVPVDDCHECENAYSTSCVKRCCTEGVESEMDSRRLGGRYQRQVDSTV